MTPYEGNMRSIEDLKRCLGEATANLADSENGNPPIRRLLSRQEIQVLLQLEAEQLEFLVNTRQIIRIRIAGEERFDSRDIDALIEAYKATAQRRAQ